MEMYDTLAQEDINATTEYLLKVMKTPEWKIIEQKDLIADAKAKIKEYKAYKQLPISSEEHITNSKQKFCDAQIIRFENEIILRENYISYLKTIQKNRDTGTYFTSSAPYKGDLYRYFEKRIIISDEEIEPIKISDRIGKHEEKLEA